MTIVTDRSIYRPSGASLPNRMRMTSGGRRSVATASASSRGLGTIRRGCGRRGVGCL